MRVIFLRRGNELRSVDSDSKTCVFGFGDKTRVTQLRCPATYAARLVEAGWSIDSIETDESAGAA